MVSSKARVPSSYCLGVLLLVAICTDESFGNPDSVRIFDQRATAISAYVYHDANGNRRLDQGEPPLPAILVHQRCDSGFSSSIDTNQFLIMYVSQLRVCAKITSQFVRLRVRRMSNGVATTERNSLS